MNTTAIREADLVRCDRLGRRFWALVTGREGRALRITPVSRNITYYRATSREVLEHYAHRSHRAGGAALRSIRPGDMVAYQHEQESMFATVLARERSRLQVLPITPGASAQELPGRAVSAHYARRGRARPPLTP